MTSSPRTLARCVAMAAAGIGFAVPGVAYGADDYRTGERVDKAGDGSIVYEYGGGGSARLVDVTKVFVEYDAGVGSLNVRFDGKGLYGHHKSGVTLSLKVSAPSGGKCDGTLRAGDVFVQASESARFYGGPEGSGYQSVWLMDANGARVGEGWLALNDDVNATISVSGPYLLRRDYRCVSAVAASKVDNGYQGESSDSVADFFLGGPPEQPATEAPKIGKQGVTLTWSKVGNHTSYVVATSLTPEGSPGRSTTYQTVSGTSYVPRAAPGATRYYGVRVNTPDSLWANPEVAIAFPPSPIPPVIPPPVVTDPVTPPPKPPGTTPVQTQTGGINQGVVVNNINTNSQNQTTTVVNLTLSVTKARGVARKALADRYGKAFSRRAKRSYKIACDPTGAKASCKVQWRYKRSRYKGKITITRTQQGDQWRTAIKRTAI